MHTAQTLFNPLGAETMQQDLLTRPYPHFVRHFAKKMNGGTVEDLLHMAIGMAGELGEYEEALDLEQCGVEVNPNETISVELGDFLFYMTGFANVLNTGICQGGSADEGFFSRNISLARLDSLLRIHTAQLLDKVKKLWAYNCELNSDTVFDLRTLIHNCSHLYCSILRERNLNITVLQMENRFKLIKRFNDGNYSDAAALARADKGAA